MRWRGKDDEPGADDAPARLIAPPPGHRAGDRPIFSHGEVVSSTYQIRALVHTDHSGQVYEAWDMLLERIVALKAAWRDADTPPLIHEARAPSAIRDPCVGEVYGLGHHRDIEFLVAERIQGEALALYTRRVYASGDALDVEMASALLAVLARGLCAVHAAGLRIPYLSARSVAILRDRRLVFCQFALGQCEQPHERVCWAPEVLQAGSPEAALSAGTAADLYALGVIACELLTGAPPYAGDSDQAQRLAHVRQRPPDLTRLRPEIPVELADLVVELLAKEPRDRPAGAADVLSQLRAIAQRVSASRRLLRVLVVDADEARVRPIQSALRRAHARVVVDTVASADAATHALREARVDVLVLDLGVAGDMNGLELVMYMRGVEEARDAAIIALTPRVDPGDVQVLEQLGVAHVIVRDGGTPARLVEIIRELAGPSHSWPSPFSHLR